MKLKDLLNGIKVLGINGSVEVDIKSLAQKIEEVKKGSLFFCFKGVNYNGHDFSDIAFEKGAVALVVEEYVSSPLPQILVKKTRNIMPKVCKNFFNNVDEKLKLIGVTGTNGKTTTTHMIYNILNNCGVVAGLIGTNGIKFNNEYIPSNLTTPDTVELFYIMQKMYLSGVKVVVMEVSAHAIDLKKIKGLKFEIGVFTNLTIDHLDYFKTMNNYAKTKLKFLNKLYCKHILINIDDDYGKLFTKLVKGNIITFGLYSPATAFAINVELNVNYTNFVANVCDEVLFISSPFNCLFNVYNLLGAITTCKLLGVNNKDIEFSTKKLEQVDGRMNSYKLKNNVTAIIDFAHTPDGLEKVLHNLQEIKNNGKIICVFGCGGNRDATKRKIMGEIADKNSDKIIITSDNPRYENPREIINQILQGVTTNNFEIEEDRATAIIRAINLAKSNDIILIAGKGAEPYQEINGVKHKFNDKDIILKYIN